MKRYLTDNHFEIVYAYAALVPPLRNVVTDYKQEIKNIKLNLNTDAGKYFMKIFDRALGDSKVAIVFKSNNSQYNVVRNSLLQYCMQSRNFKKLSFDLACKLSVSTDNRNGKGLFLVLVGKKAKTYRIILNRFKADEVLFAKSNQLELFLEFLEEAFTKKSNHYKMAVFEDDYNVKSFWNGYAIDKQIAPTGNKDISNYWIEDFLECSIYLTDYQGTKELTGVIKKILNEDLSLDQKEQLVSSIILLKHVNRPITINEFANNLKDDTQKLIKSFFNNDDKILNTPFSIDLEIYTKLIGDTLSRLDNGAIIYAPTFLYDNIVSETQNEDGTTEVNLRGKLVDKKLKTKVNYAKRPNKKNIHR